MAPRRSGRPTASRVEDMPLSSYLEAREQVLRAQVLVLGQRATQLGMEIASAQQEKNRVTSLLRGQR